MSGIGKKNNGSRIGAVSLGVIAILVFLQMRQSSSSCGIQSTPPSPTPSPSDFLKRRDKVSSYENISNPVIGLFPGWDEESYINRSQLDASSLQIVPARLIVVVGLESSGTTFVQEILAKAAGATKQYDVEYFSPDYSLRVQHFSLPTGWFRKTSPGFKQRFEPLAIAPVYIPTKCRLGPGLSIHPSPSQCHILFGPKKVPSAPRYFVNITSHVNFYRRRGVDTTAVIVVRDPALHFRGILKNHCGNETAAFEQYKTGRAIIQYAIDHLDPDSFLIVSYETLMTLQGGYLKEIYKSLNIQTNYIPKFKNGNIAYAPDGLIYESIKDKLKTDAGIPTGVAHSTNLYEPKSLKEIRGGLAKTK